ncbi:hypothetical protein HH310_12500 [Actinoplanes sp. TBRC 11911]|uniref:hypothetical protein n=1 Tax=Actinoplanes sp. TBRC 11911 TaxID=2729386 RepID=UPI00145F5DA1|nr:hypothetical protein [Actinoplanes sp. TBRC 11911]NMO52013.1 hypothetical protein [Actinoplanes sp. TBRC 11911]
MALTPAERQRRSRAHRKGNHEWCDPEACADVTPVVTPVAEPAVTEDVTDPRLSQLGARGRRLYSDTLAEHPDLSPRARVVLEEAARTADRLERLDALLRGDVDEFASVRFADGRTELVVDRTLGEARAQQASLARLLSELRQQLDPADAQPSVPATPPPAAAAPAGPKRGGKLVDLQARIAAARAATAG